MPTIIPKVIAKAKPLKTSPPKISTATILKSVVPEVFNVLERVLFNDSFIKIDNSDELSFFKFSLILS